MSRREIFDADMKRVLSYHVQLVRLCRQLCAIHVDGDLFDKLTRREFKHVLDNQSIRWALEDRIRELLRKHGDFPRRTLADKEKP